MVDTFRPLRITKQAAALEDERYPYRGCRPPPHPARPRHSPSADRRRSRTRASRPTNAAGGPLPGRSSAISTTRSHSARRSAAGTRVQGTRSNGRGRRSRNSRPVWRPASADAASQMAVSTPSSTVRGVRAQEVVEGGQRLGKARRIRPARVHRIGDDPAVPKSARPLAHQVTWARLARA